MDILNVVNSARPVRLLVGNLKRDKKSAVAGGQPKARQRSAVAAPVASGQPEGAHKKNELSEEPSSVPDKGGMRMASHDSGARRERRTS